MIELNNKSIFVGQIKQLLANFNLPNCIIGDSNPGANKHYINKDFIFLWDENLNSKQVEFYNFGQPYLNLTTNLKISNNLYDRYTHRYLGRYLRFLRDYKKIDLMSMYNCFDGQLNEEKIQVNLPIKTQLEDEVEGIVAEEAKSISFTATNKDNFIVYRIPISKNKLTISIHCDKLIQMCLLVNEAAQDTKQTELRNSICNKTYSTQKISDYAVIDIFKNENDRFTAEEKNFINQNANNLYLLLKVPKKLNKSIVVLEGDNYISYKNENIVTDKGFKFQIASQLLSYQNDKNYLLADRLVEYLTGNAITYLNANYEIKRLQLVLLKKGDYITKDWVFGQLSECDINKIKELIYNEDSLTHKFDMIGFLDKDIEKILRGELDNVNI